MMIFALVSKIKSLIQSFKTRVLSQGRFEGETCLDAQLTDLNNKGLLDSASLIITPNGYKENVLFSVTPSPVGTNLLLRSEEFDNSYWNKTRCSIVSNQEIAPNGTLTADYVVDDNTTGLRYVGVIGVPTSIGQTYTFSVFVKKKDRSRIMFQINEGSSLFPTVVFDFDSQVFTQTTPLLTSSFQSVGNGWFRIILTRTPTTGTSSVIGIFPTDVNGNYSGIGDGVSRTIIWGAQLEIGTTVGPYIATTTRQVINETICDLSFTRATLAYRINQDKLVEPSPYNLFSWSEDFSNSLWNKNNLTITTNRAIAPDGNNTADLYVPNTTTGEHQFNQVLTSTGAAVLVTPTNEYNWTIYVKSAGNDYFLLRARLGGIWYQNTYNLSTGTVVASPNFINADIEDVGDGWYRLSCTFTNVDTPNTMQFVSTPNGSAGFTGDGISGAYIWGAQLTLGSVKRDYFPTTTRFNVPRLDYTNDSCPSILVEPQMTNSWTNNNNTSGYTSNTNAVKGATISNAFGEGFNGFEYNFIGGGQIFISASNFIRVFDTRTLPVQRLCLYIKAPSSDFFGINYTNVGEVIYRFSTLEVSNSTIGAIKKINEDTYALYIHTDTAVTGQFSQVRVAFVTSLTDDTNVDGSAILGLGYYQGAATGTVQIQNYNYTPIIAGAGAVTRNADFLFNYTSAINLIGQTEGTIFLDFDRTLVFAGIKALLTLYSVINDETFHIQTSNNSYLAINVTIISVANGVSVSRSMTLLEGRNKLAVVYSTSGTKIFLNGTQLTPLANTALPVMNTINLSNRTGQRIYGPIRQFSLWKTQITDTQAIELTTL